MTKKLIVAVALILCSWPVFAKKVHWKGKWAIKQSIESTFPIIGNVEETTGELTLTFTEDLGSTGNTPNWTVTLDESVQNGTVTVTDGVNLVYGEINF